MNGDAAPSAPVAEILAAYNVRELRAELADRFPHVRRNYGQHWHRATKRDLATSLHAARCIRANPDGMTGSAAR